MNGERDERWLECFECGEAVDPGPRGRGVRRSMRYLVAYDVCAPKRLRRVALTCEDYGVRVQKSVFECDLEPAQFESLWRALQLEIDEGEDYLVAYALCRSCSERAVSSGVMVRPEKVLAYIC